MCGIAGVLAPSTSISASLLQPMAHTLRHRGPDDSGIWCDPACGIGLVHTRLAILDLSAEGHQPMVSRSGRYVIVFNGEVYNFQELRSRLEGPWHGHSDTEIVLHAIETWGLRRTLEACLGMFAFAVWDREARELSLARDRLGVKPLYLARTAQGFAFASELKAIRTLGDFDTAIHRNVLPLLLRHGYIPAPHTIYRDAWKLRPGTWLTICADDARMSERWNQGTYWSAAQVASDGLAHPHALSPDDATHALESLLMDSVRLRMVADVPLGAFLSGGIDSSLVVALMQAQSARPIRTFSIGFHEKAFDEAPHAKAIAQTLGTAHTELYVTDAEAREVIPTLPVLFDEPFADPSQIPTHLVSALARRSVTVALSGDGGDELFCGYDRYQLLRRAWGRTRWLPRAFRTPLSAALRGVPEHAWDRILRTTAAVLPRAVPKWAQGHHVHSLAEYLRIRDALPFYRRIVSTTSEPLHLLRTASEASLPLDDEAPAFTWADPAEFAMQCDLTTYLPDDVLLKVDRASMSVGLEARNPFLDHRVVEFAWRTPFSQKLNAGRGKWILRQILYRHVPQRLIDRPKMGFGVPIGEWLRGPLRDWAEDLLDPRALHDEGYFMTAELRRCWESHVAGTRNAEYLLWSILMFQAWLRAEASLQSRAASAA